MGMTITLKTLIKNVILAALLVTIACILVYAQAGGTGKAVKTGVEVIVKGKLPTGKTLNQLPKRKSSPQRLYNYSAKTEQTIRASIAEGTFGRQPQIVNLLQTATPENGNHNLIIVQDSPALTALIKLRDETKFYQPEIDQGYRLLQKLDEVQQLTPAVLADIQADIAALHNNSLQQFLTESLQRGDIAAMRQDLTDYYLLNGKDMAQSSYEYLMRHPHKPTLALRRLLRQPLVDKELQQAAANLLQKNLSTPAEKEEAWKIIKQMVEQFQSRVQIVNHSLNLTERLSYYEYKAQELEDFIALNGRRPKWNTPNKEEAKLYKELEWIFLHTDKLYVEELQQAYKKVLDLWNAHTPKYLSYEETIEAFEDFVAKTGRAYPRNYRNSPEKENVPDTEAQLYDDLAHWQLERPEIISTLTQIRQKYGVK